MVNSPTQAEKRGLNEPPAKYPTIPKWKFKAVPRKVCAVKGSSRPEGL
jgi:hypothetical protein